MKVGLDSEHKPADFYDSEMFDWTQRPCSPELFSTPMKRKVNLLFPPLNIFT